jgi:hypothetical protein
MVSFHALKRASAVYDGDLGRWATLRRQGLSREGGTMGRGMRGVAAAFAALAIACAVSAPASAQTTGSETIRAVTVVSGASGAPQVVSGSVIAQGVFNGVGRIVETQSQAGDRDNVSRQDLVFAAGSIHVVIETEVRSFSADPRTCVFNAVRTQTTTVEGGTGQFDGASGSFSGTVTAWGSLSRAVDGSCSREQPPLHESDMSTAYGWLSF